VSANVEQQNSPILEKIAGNRKLFRVTRKSIQNQSVTFPILDRVSDNALDNILGGELTAGKRLSKIAIVLSLSPQYFADGNPLPPEAFGKASCKCRLAGSGETNQRNHGSWSHLGTLVL
jgi:hypothetical protein